MPIPISQTLQLAGQQEVTPWQLPFEELSMGLSGKQDTYDKAVETTTTALSQVDEGGLHTTDLRNKMLEDYRAEEQGLLEDLEMGIVNTGKIKSFASRIVNDPRNQALKYDREVFSPMTAQAKYNGTLDNSATNLLDENGNYAQVGKVEDFSQLGYVANEDYVEYLTERLKPFVNDKQAMANSINSNFNDLLKSGQLKEILGEYGISDDLDGVGEGDLVKVTYLKDGTPSVVTLKAGYEQIVESLTFQYLKERTLTPSPDGGLSYAQSIFNNNHAAVNYWSKANQYAGKANDFGAFTNEAVLPILQFLAFENKSISNQFSKTATPLSTDGGGGGASETPEASSDYQVTSIMSGISANEQFTQALKDAGVDINKEDIGLTDLTTGINNTRKMIGESKDNNQRRATTLNELYNQNLPSPNFTRVSDSDDEKAAQAAEPFNFEFITTDEDGFLKMNIKEEDYVTAALKYAQDNEIEMINGIPVTNQSEVIESLKGQHAFIINDANSKSINSDYEINTFNSSLMTQSQSLENLTDTRDYLFKLEGVDMSSYEKNREEISNTIPEKSWKSSAVSNILNKNKMTPAELERNNYVYSTDFQMKDPLTNLVMTLFPNNKPGWWGKDFFNLDNPEEAALYDQKLRFVAESFMPQDLKLLYMNPNERDDERIQNYFAEEIDKLKTEDYSATNSLANDAQNEVDEKAKEDLTPKQLEALNKDIDVRKDLMLRSQNIYFFNPFAPAGSSAEISQRKEFIRTLTQGVQNEMISLTDLSNVRFTYTNGTLDGGGQNYLRQLLNGAVIKTTSVEEDGGAAGKIVLYNEVSKESFDVAFKYDDGEFNADGSPKLKIMLRVPNMQEKDGNVKKTLKGLGKDESDLILDWIEIDIPNEQSSSLYQNLDNEFRNTDSNYTRLIDQARQNHILKEVTEKGYTTTTLYYDDEDPSNDVGINWAQVAGDNPNETRYEGYISIAGKENEMQIIATNPYQIANIEKTIKDMVAYEDEVAAAITAGGYEDIVAQFQNVIYSGEMFNEEGQKHSSSQLLTTLINLKPAYTEAQFNGLGVKVKEGTYKYISSDNILPLTQNYLENNTEAIKKNISGWTGEIRYGDDLSGPILTKEVKSSYESTLSKIGEFLVSNNGNALGLSGYDIVIESALRSKETVEALPEESGKVSWSKSNHSLGRSVDITLKDANGNKANGKAFEYLEEYLKYYNISALAHGDGDHLHLHIDF